MLDVSNGNNMLSIFNMIISASMTAVINMIIVILKYLVIYSIVYAGSSLNILSLSEIVENLIALLINILLAFLSVIPAIKLIRWLNQEVYLYDYRKYTAISLIIAIFIQLVFHAF